MTEHHNYRMCSFLPLNLGVRTPDSKVHGANTDPAWGRQDPGGPLGSRETYYLGHYLLLPSGNKAPHYHGCGYLNNSMTSVNTPTRYINLQNLPLDHWAHNKNIQLTTVWLLTPFFKKCTISVSKLKYTRWCTTFPEFRTNMLVVKMNSIFEFIWNMKVSETRFK